MLRRHSFYKKYGKRVIDIVCSLFFLVLFWWLYLVIAALVRIMLGSPVLFQQQRPGKNGRPFALYKFRTMTEAKDGQGNLLPDDVRLTRFGRFLRSTSLDELPEIFMILSGDMSIVGPRPLLVKYLPLYNAHQSRRHEVKPGLTGYAQVHGRNSVSWEEKFDMDVWYVDHVSFLLDIKILIQTVVKVLKKDGISAEGMATMSEFEGTRNIDE